MPYKNEKDRRERAREWNLDNPERVKRNKARHYQKHKERLKRLSKQHKQNNQEYYDEYNKQYYFEHKEELFEYKKRYWQIDKGKETRKRHKAKRKGLGFITLNKYFDGCEGHHISKNLVIYMPKELHKSIWHCLWTGKNMDAINKLAIEFI